MDQENHRTEDQHQLKSWSLIFPLAVVAIFGLYFLTSPEEEATNEIRITTEMAHMIATEREAVIGRKPSQAELETLVSNYAEEEMMIHEANARGIKCEGCGGRKHLVDRLLFIMDEPSRPPTDDELVAFLSEHQQDYQAPNRVSFEQVFFTKTTPEVAKDVLQELKNGADRKSFGERYWMGNEMANISRIEVETSMGSSFADALFSAPNDQWSGPFTSSRGNHLIRVTGRRDARPAKLEEVRIQLEHDWARMRRLTARVRLVNRFRESYVVIIDPLEGILK